MPDLETPAAPAQPETPAAPPTASQQAVDKKDFGAYERARWAEKAPAAKPADAPVPATPEAPKAAAPAPAVEPKKTSNRQAQINDYERTIAQLRADVDRLSATAPPKPPAPALKAEPSPADPEPDPSDATKYPDGQYDRKFLKDQARWEARDELRAHEASQREARDQAQTARTRAEAERAYTTRSTAFVEKITAARDSDAAAYDRIDPRLFDLVPSIKRPEGEPITFGHAVADALLTSDHPVALMLHLSDPAEVDRLAALSPDAFYRELGRIEMGIAQKAQPAAPPIPQLTNAPPPPPTVGDRAASPSDPKLRAVAEKNWPAYEAARWASVRATQR